MKERIFVFSCLLLVVFLPAVSEAQQQMKVSKIGELIFRGPDRPGLGAGREVFRAKLRELGYVDGKNIVYETRFAENKLDRYPALADELVRLKVDVCGN
jgi:putative ABC transport system substrate-binding protein